MKSKSKFIILVSLIVVWISFIRWADSSLPPESSDKEIQISKPVQPCQELKIEKDTLENEASSLAKQAMEIQSTLMRDRLKEIADSRILSQANSDLLIEYVNYDIKKLIENREDIFGPAFERNIQIRPTIVKLVERLIKQGDLQPYYFVEVQDMGRELRSKFENAREIVDQNKQCFKFESEINQMIEETNQELSIDKNYNGWIASHTAEELVESIK
jgi:hypothetical protein